MNAVAGYALKKLADLGLAKAAETLKKSKGKLETDAAAVEAALDYHLRGVKNWCSEISFSDLRTPKATAGVFVPLNIFLHPRRRRITDDDGTNVVSLESVLIETLNGPPPVALTTGLEPPSQRLTPPPPRHLLILGQPGAGSGLRQYTHLSASSERS